MNNETKEQVIKDYNVGYSMDWIADKHSVTRQTIYKIAKDNGCILRRSTEIKTCPQCNKQYKTQSKNQKAYCSKACYIKHLKSLNTSYFEGLRLKGLSVRQWQRKARQLANSYIKLNKEWIIHHLNGDISDLSPNNLFIFIVNQSIYNITIG